MLNSKTLRPHGLCTKNNPCPLGLNLRLDLDAPLSLDLNFELTDCLDLYLVSRSRL